MSPLSTQTVLLVILVVYFLYMYIYCSCSTLQPNFSFPCRPISEFNEAMWKFRLSRPGLRTLGKLVALVVVGVLLYRHAATSSATRSSHPALLDASFTGDRSAGQLAVDTYRKFRYDAGASWVDSYSLQRNLMQVRKGPRRGSQVEDLDDLRFYDGDPRLAWTVLLDQYLRRGADVEFGFSWYDWADFGDWNKLLALEDTDLDCSVVFGKHFELEFLRKVEAEVGDVLFLSERGRYDDRAWYEKQKLQENEEYTPPGDLSEFCKVRPPGRFQLPFEVGQLHEGVRPEVFSMQARTYLLSHVVQPLSLSVMQGDVACYQLKVDQRTRENMVESGVLRKYLEAHELEFGDQDDIVFDHLAAYETFLNSPVAEQLRIDIPGVDSNVTSQQAIPLSPADFEVDIKSIIAELKHLGTQNKLSSHEAQYLESLEHSVRTSPWLTPKYYTEAPRVKEFDGMGSHRDARFFKEALIWNPEEYNARLNSLVRNWLKFSNANGLLTWVAHGSAYGHLYNGQRFPWDNDHDVQMPIKHLHLLSRHFNQTLVMEDPREGNGRFLVDVGDTITTRTRGNKRNNIDARFIDIDSGLYVDITGLSVSSSPVSDHFKSYYNDKSPSVDLSERLKTFESPERGLGLGAFSVEQLSEYAEANPDHFDDSQKQDIREGREEENDTFNKEGASESGLTPDERYIMNQELQLYNCRNNHFSSFRQLSPLQRTLFHGTKAFLPSKNLETLRNEYHVPSLYSFQVFEGKALFPALHSWFTYSVLKDFTKTNRKYPALESLKSPVANLDVEEVVKVFRNMLKLDLTQLFAIQYMSFDSTAYRLKELEIQYDDTIEKSDRQRLLQILGDEIAPKVISPGKDPVLYNYERNLWRELTMLLGVKKAGKIESSVDKKMVDELYSNIVEMHNHELPLFEVRDSANKLVEDLKKSGKPVSNTRLIFQADPNI